MREGTLVAGRFEVHRLAGAGGMGTVYRAIDQLTGRPVALKVAAPELAARFRREARLLEAVQHPLIVQHIAHGTGDDGALWLVGHSVGMPVTGSRSATAPQVSIGAGCTRG